MSDLNVAVVAAANKNYKEFESTLDQAVKEKISNKLQTFITHLEKNTFVKDIEDE